jgi:hypothetical protein
LFTFVDVNDERIHDEGSGHRRNGSFTDRAKRRDRDHRRKLFVVLIREEKNNKGAVMKKVAIYAGLFAVLASPFPALATTAAQSSAQAKENSVSITGKVSCSKFGIGSITARKAMSIAQTIQYCVNFQGGVYTLVSGKQIYRLTGDSNLLAKMSGQTVAVAGQVSPEEPATSYALMGNLQATSIAPAKN